MYVDGTIGASQVSQAPLRSLRSQMNPVKWGIMLEGRPLEMRPLPHDT